MFLFVTFLDSNTNKKTDSSFDNSNDVQSTNNSDLTVESLSHLSTNSKSTDFGKYEKKKTIHLQGNIRFFFFFKQIIHLLQYHPIILEHYIKCKIQLVHQI